MNDPDEFAATEHDPVVLLVGVFVAGLWTAGRAALRGPPEQALLAFLWLLVCIGVWNALGTIAGIPMDALTWLALGLAAAAVPRFTGMTSIGNPMGVEAQHATRRAR